MNDKFLTSFEIPMELSEEQLSLFKFKVVKVKKNKKLFSQIIAKRMKEEEDKLE
ncbi:MAG: hypothetical protein LBR15_00570 [Methanobrevibacter sp.]|nr:hypothetical protein [Candidatus Methanovirga australis]